MGAKLDKAKGKAKTALKSASKRVKNKTRS